MAEGEILPSGDLGDLPSDEPEETEEMEDQEMPDESDTEEELTPDRMEQLINALLQ